MAAVDDLSLLTITSKSMRNLVECYRVSMFHTREVIVHSRAHGVLDVENQAEWLQRYKKLGKFPAVLLVRKTIKEWKIMLILQKTAFLR